MILPVLIYIGCLSFAWCNQDFAGDQVLRIFPSNKEDTGFLMKWIEDTSMELDVWQERQYPNISIDVHVPSNKLQIVKAVLNSKKIKFIILINDLSKAVDEENQENQKNAFAFGYDYSRYNRYNEIQQELRNIASKNPRIAQLHTLGDSFEKREMTMIKISSNFGERKPIVWIDGGIHAREWISPATVMYIVREIVKVISEGRTTRHAALDFEFHILPVFNVDGYEYTHTYNRMWRKTRSRLQRSRCVGVDPNRNWKTDFGNVGVSRSPCSDIYPGLYAFSEKEVQNVVSYLRGIKDRLKSFWTFHAYSQLVLTPWGYTRRSPPDYAKMMRVGQVFANKLRTYYGTRYRVGSPAQILYPASGGSIDWVYEELKVVYSYGLELRDTGRYGFVLPPSQIRPSGVETSGALFAALDAMK